MGADVIGQGLGGAIGQAHRQHHFGEFQREVCVGGARIVGDFGRG